ncbi:MAG: heme ABC exporter ATP-binding protein CcmA [Methyloceanibacter sp.]|uniref:heme ABC exporter ATP-binding protein CcmA n=1 Tax=Methyloceanibacter sp. TaxID=1965321 RepID=UPI003D6D57F7
MQMPLKVSLAAHDIACERGGRMLFQGLSFALEPGEGLLVTGPNGAGKTSLLRQIAGLLPLAAGRLSVAGAEADMSIAELCHYVGHLGGIKTALSVRENVAFWASFLEDGERSLDETLKGFALDALADLPAGLLSAGQKRRLALARLFAAKRPIWLLDEPTASLDDRSTVLINRAIALHLHSGGVAIVASHTPSNLLKHKLALGKEHVA